MADETAKTTTNPSAGTTTNPFAKFGIGLVAGFAAVLLPRLVASLAQGDATTIVFIPTPYYYLALLIGAFLGAVMVIFEYQKPAAPRETFMTALALPAVIAGGLGTASGVGSVADLKGESERLQQAFRQEEGIVRQGSFNSIEPLGGATPGASGQNDSSPFPSLISFAYAGGPAQALAQAEPLKFGIQIQQSRYVVVLKQTKTEQEAIQDAQRFRTKVPSARAVKADNGFYVISGEGPQFEVDALLSAARAKRALTTEKVQPRLVEVRK